MFESKFNGTREVGDDKVKLKTFLNSLTFEMGKILKITI